MIVMKKTRVLVSGVSVATVAVLIGGGFLLLNHPNKPDRLGSNFDNQQVAGANTTEPNSPTSGSSSISLNQVFDAPELGGLSVGANNSTNSVTQAAGTQQPSSPMQSSAPNSSGSGAQSNPFDPASFMQYDKYKSDKGALFGEVQVGTGATLEAGKKAAVFYRGWLTNGDKFDESHAGSDGKLTPFIFTLGAHQVIPGWEQALAGMKVGGVRLIVVPPLVGYGATGQGSIPPNSVLVFQVQLSEVQ